MRRIAMISGVLAAAVVITASTLAQPWEPEVQFGTLNAACQQGHLAACVKFGVLIGSHPAQRPELMRAHPEWFWWANE
jgi:hypothetical protein